MTRIFPQKGAVIGNPLRSPFAVPEIGAEATQKKRESHRESAVAYLATEIGETPIITPRCAGEKIVRCSCGTHRGQCDNSQE
jgi:hypothetical protein